MIVGSIIFTGGLSAIPLAALVALDIATVANILSKAVISGQPLDTFDLITLGLVGFANAGAIARALKPVLKETSPLFKIQNDLDVNIARLGENAAAKTKIQNQLDKLKAPANSGEITNTVITEPIETTLHRLRKTGFSGESLNAARKGLLKTRGFSDYFAEELSKSKIINKISDVKIDNRLTSPLATKIIRNADGTTTYELIVGKGGMDKLKPYLRFGLEHEYSEILKDEMRIQGKIASESKLVDMVFELKISTEAKQELYNMFEHRLFADKISLRARPELLGEWKIETKSLLKQLDQIEKGGVIIEKDLVSVAYLKALNPIDTEIMKKVDSIINGMPLGWKLKFDEILTLSEEVIKDV